MEKKNKYLIILIVVLAILVLGLGGYIVYDKVLSGTNDALDLETKVDDSQNKVDNSENKDVNTGTVKKKEIHGNTMVTNNSREGACSDGCTKKITVNGVSYEVYADKRTLKFNDNTILTLENISFLAQVSFYDDIVITLQTTGTGGEIVIYDYDGNKLKESSQFKDEQGRLFYTVTRYDDLKDFNVTSDGHIQFVGSKHLQGGAGTYLNDDGKSLYLCEDRHGISDDSIVSGIFEFSYLGNNKFSDFKYVSTLTTVKDLNCG